jgi:hypothetical protein
VRLRFFARIKVLYLVHQGTSSRRGGDGWGAKFETWQPESLFITADVQGVGHNADRPTKSDIFPDDLSLAKKYGSAWPPNDQR